MRQLGAPDFSDSPVLSDAIRGAAITQARSPRKLPAWDLVLFLDSLRNPPDEPLLSATLKDLSL